MDYYYSGIIVWEIGGWIMRRQYEDRRLDHMQYGLWEMKDTRYNLRKIKNERTQDGIGTSNIDDNSRTLRRIELECGSFRP